MVVPPVLFIDPTNGLISIKLKRPLESRAAEAAGRESGISRRFAARPGCAKLRPHQLERR
jgi:hypothetical protein